MAAAAARLVESAVGLCAGASPFTLSSPFFFPPDEVHMPIPLRPVPRVTSASAPATSKGAETKVHPKTLIESVWPYPTEEDCRRALFAHRWRHGFSWRRCGHERAWYLRGRGLYECASCHYQSSPTAGRILSCKLPTSADVDRWLPWSHSVLSSSSAGPWRCSAGSAPRTCRHTSTSTATSSIAATGARISSAARSIPACSAQPLRPLRCSQLPERRRWAWRSDT